MGEIVTSNRLVSLGLPFETLDPVVDEILSFLVVASVSDEAKLDLVAEAVKIFDNVLLPLVREELDEAALYYIPDYTGVDAFDLIDCVGGNALSETLSWAANTLLGTSEPAPEAVSLYAECTGIGKELFSADERLLASAVIYTMVAAINKMLASLIH